MLHTASAQTAPPAPIFPSTRQIATNTGIWAIVLYQIYRVQLANELTARKSFLHVLDKNNELMKAEEDKRALADDNRKLAADNARIRKQVAVSGMNEMQVQLVQVRTLVCCMHSAPTCRET